MIEKYITLIENQISNLDKSDFDLEAWKSSTIVVLSRVFGDDQNKMKQIKDLRVDFGSWTLRDTDGLHSEMANCKIRGRAVLEAAIVELRTLGVPEETTEIESKEVIGNVVLKVLEEELRGSELRALKAMLQQNSDEKVLRQLVEEKFTGFGSSIAEKIVSAIVLMPEVRKALE